MAAPTTANLKAIKNEVIGNPTAKAAFAQSELLPSLLHLLSADSPLRIDAAQVISSVAYGSTDALDSLLRVDAPRILLHCIARFKPGDPPVFKSSLIRALGNLIAGCADIIGPPLWGIIEECPGLSGPARLALDEIFKTESLDTWLPLLQDPSEQVVLATAAALSTGLRVPEHRNLVFQWVPLSERRASSSRRGWEQQSRSVPRLGWITHQIIQILINSDNSKCQETALLAFAAIIKDNTALAPTVAKDILFKEIIAFTSSRSTGCQLAACLAIVNALRAQNSSSPSRSSATSQNLIRTIATNSLRLLSRVVENTGGVYVYRTQACFILSYLVTDDPELELAACSAGVLKLLVDLLQKIHDAALPQWLDVEFEYVSRLREAALLAIACLAMHQDDVRRDAISLSIIPILHASLTHSHIAVRHAACQCARALTRSVQVLRTSVVDSGIGTIIFDLAKNPGEDRRVRTAALAALCNLLNSFSPFREAIISQGGAQHLAAFLDTSEYPWKLNALWAIKNALNSCRLPEKRAIMEQVGWERLKSLAMFGEEGLQEQAFAILRNLAYPPSEIAFLLSALDRDDLVDLTETGISSISAEILTQGVGLFTNLVAGPTELRTELLGRPKVMLGLKESLQHALVEVRRAAMQCVLQLVKAEPRRHGELREYGFDVTMRHMYGSQGVAGAAHFSHGSLMGYEEDRQVRRDLKSALTGLDFVGE